MSEPDGALEYRYATDVASLTVSVTRDTSTQLQTQFALDIRVCYGEPIL